MTSCGRLLGCMETKEAQTTLSSIHPQQRITKVIIDINDKHPSVIITSNH